MRFVSLSRLLAVLVIGAIQATYVDHHVHRLIYEEHGAVDVIISFSKGGLLGKFAFANELNWVPGHSDLIEVLDQVQNKFYIAHAQTLEWLDYLASTKYPGFKYNVLWAYDSIWVTGMDKTTLNIISELEPTCRIVKDRRFTALSPVITRKARSAPIGPSTKKNQTQWGVRLLNAPEAWQKGYNGQGVVVGVIDTGIRASHNMLKDKIRKKYSWYDAVHGREKPYDDNGHGTHCAGTVAGANGFGVAPGAGIIACKALDEKGRATTGTILTCGQFMLCPTDPSGDNADCSQAPKIITNSWGGEPEEGSWFNTIVDTWKLNLQISIFATGNTGPGCGTVVSPADYAGAIAVGAVDSSYKVTNFSSRGPPVDQNLLDSSLCLLASDALMKPDVVAPGKSITSAGTHYDDHLVTMSGTSMAAPHVAGLVAILCSHNPNLTQTVVQQLLQDSAVPTAKIMSTGFVENTECGCTSLSTSPNNLEGYGFVQFPAYFMGTTTRRYPTGKTDYERKPQSNNVKKILPVSLLGK